MPESLLQPILIVDSDEQSVDNISSGLKANGYLVITAPDGYDAVSYTHLTLPTKA